MDRDKLIEQAIEYRKKTYGTDPYFGQDPLVEFAAEQVRAERDRLKRLVESLTYAHLQDNRSLIFRRGRWDVVEYDSTTFSTHDTVLEAFEAVEGK